MIEYAIHRRPMQTTVIQNKPEQQQQKSKEKNTGHSEKETSKTTTEARWCDHTAAAVAVDDENENEAYNWKPPTWLSIQTKVLENVWILLHLQCIYVCLLSFIAATLDWLDCIYRQTHTHTHATTPTQTRRHARSVTREQQKSNKKEAI